MKQIERQKIYKRCIDLTRREPTFPVDPATKTTSFSFEAPCCLLIPDALATDPVADAFIDAIAIK